MCAKRRHNQGCTRDTAKAQNCPSLKEDVIFIKQIHSMVKINVNFCLYNRPSMVGGIKVVCDKIEKQKDEKSGDGRREALPH